MTLGQKFCYVLTILKLHRPDCERCNCLPECWGDQMRKRLYELNQQHMPEAEPPKPDEREKAS